MGPREARPASGSPTQKMASPSRLSGSLQRFRLDGVRDIGITVGDGAYATVLQYDFRGLKCVGKKIHSLLYEHASPAQKVDILRRFEEECELLGRLLHPNIVQFLGVHVETGSELPVLVMEYLPTNLSGYLDRHDVLPTEISYSILRDVALGLRYLHEYLPPIIHRDLSANNVLLTACLAAKISDLGVSKILNITPSQMTQQMSTKAPGTPCYMPPEALMARPRYTRKIDSYSFGVMILHVLCGEWPFPTDAFQPDAHNPGTIVPVTEVDRRTEFLQKMGTDHPLSGLVRRCLSNTPDERPESADILQQINTALSQVPAPAETMFQQLEGLRSEVQMLRTDNQNQKTEIERLMSEVLRLNQTLREHSQTQPSSFGAAVNQPLTCEIERLSVHDLGPPVRAATNGTESQLHPGVRLQWRRCADVPVKMHKAQVIVVGEEVYVGGGTTTNIDDRYKVFQYNKRGDTWSTLPRCPVRLFNLAQFMGRIITVGGLDQQNSPTNKIYELREKTQQWEEFLVPMPTARFFLSVATTLVAIIAAGGWTSTSSTCSACSSTVEVYISNTSEWHAADPLPDSCARMTSATIDDVWFLLGGVDRFNSVIKDCWCASLHSLVHKALSHSESESVWDHLPPTPLALSTAACLSGSLMAIGGARDGGFESSALYVFINNSWVRLRNVDLPSPRSSCATVQLSPVDVIVIGGKDKQDQLSETVFIGTLMYS